MNLYDRVLDAVLAMAGQVDLYAPILVGSLPEDDGIAMAVSAGGPDRTFLRKAGGLYSMSLVVNAKHTDQAEASNALGRIHEHLTRSLRYPQGTDYQITDIQTVGGPSYAGREQNGQWLYVSSVRVNFFVR